MVYVMFDIVRNLKSKYYELSNEESLRAVLVRGATGVFFLNVIGALFSLISGVILARVLGADGYGTYTYCLTIILFILIPVCSGLPNLLIRYVAVYKAQEKWSYMKGLLIYSNVIAVVYALLFGVILGVVVWKYGNYFNYNIWLIIFTLLLMPVFALSSVRAAYLRGLNHVVIEQLSDSLVKPVCFLFILLVIYLYYRDI